MVKRYKVWSSAPLAGAAAVALLAGCGQQTPGKAAQTQTQLQDHHAMTPAPAGGSGEGEGVAADIDLRTDNVDYLLQISLIEGHLLVGHALCQQGHYDLAEAHMRHPEIELYPALEPALTARGAKPFLSELHELAEAVERNAPIASVDAAYARARAAIADAAAAHTVGALKDPKTVFVLAEKILRVAGSEYANAVKDGKIVAVGEYQDAYGFTQVARKRLRDLGPGGPKVAKALAEANKQIDALSGAWPKGQLVPPEHIDATPSMFYGAAARIEIAGLTL